MGRRHSIVGGCVLEAGTSWAALFEAFVVDWGYESDVIICAGPARTGHVVGWSCQVEVHWRSWSIAWRAALLSWRGCTVLTSWSVGVGSTSTLCRTVVKLVAWRTVCPWRRTPSHLRRRTSPRREWTLLSWRRSSPILRISTAVASTVTPESIIIRPLIAWDRTLSTRRPTRRTIWVGWRIAVARPRILSIWRRMSHST